MTRTDCAPKRLLWLAALWAVLTIAWMCGACGNSQYAWRAPTRAEVPANATAQVVRSRVMYQTPSEVPPGWRRSDDALVGPYYFLFSTQGYACLTNAADWTMAQDREDWLCEWRVYR